MKQDWEENENVDIFKYIIDTKFIYIYILCIICCMLYVTVCVTGE